ncbi:MAG: hypothetical protein LT071_00005 [Nocardioides sp.]|nr:hypothetical protein [Nocardioides sp.]
MDPTTASVLRVAVAVTDDWREPWVAALATAGVGSSHRAAVGLVVSRGRAPRPESDRWSVESRPHLLVDAREDRIDVGPWVLPGTGPCARCVEAATLDVGDPRPVGPLDPALVTLAAGWVARDLRAWLRGETPTTWATSWRLDHAPAPTPRRWQRHPYCGCAWFETA